MHELAYTNYLYTIYSIYSRYKSQCKYVLLENKRIHRFSHFIKYYKCAQCNYKTPTLELNLTRRYTFNHYAEENKEK